MSFSTELEGIIIGGQDGVGAQIWATTDGGRTTTPAALDAEAPALLLLDGDALRDDSVASGVFAAWSSQDSAQVYRPAEGPGSIGPAQSVDGFIQGGDAVFVITGDTILFNGISISRDGGRTFAAGIEVFEDRQTEFNIGARYGAFPTESAWYVSGGRFPTTSSRGSGGGTDDKEEEEEEEEGQEFHISENIHLRKHGDGSNSTTKNNGNGSSSLRFTPQHEGAQEAAADPTNPYTAGIAKSEDGGATWRTIFESVDEGYYFNQISCFDVRKTPLLLSLFVLEMPSFCQDRLGTKHSRDSSTQKEDTRVSACRRSAAWSLRREGVTRRSSPPRTAGA